MMTRGPFTLVVDVGNSNIVIGLCAQNKIQKTWRIPTEASAVKAWVRSFPKSKPIAKTIVSSVVPTIHPVLKKAFKRLGSPIHLLTYRDFPSLKLKVRRPDRIGIDRLVNTVAAQKLFPRQDLLIVDIGTATTLDVVTRKGEFLGGVIAPGPQTVNAALFEKCAQLPRSSLSKPRKVIGKDTKHAIQAGVYYGYLGLLEGLIGRIQREFGQKLSIIMTGGPSPLFAPDFPEAIADPLLTLQGLASVQEASSRRLKI